MENHPGAQRATPPESRGDLALELPSSDEEGWRAERRGGLNREGEDNGNAREKVYVLRQSGRNSCTTDY